MQQNKNDIFDQIRKKKRVIMKAVKLHPSTFFLGNPLGHHFSSSKYKKLEIIPNTKIRKLQHLGHIMSSDDIWMHISQTKIKRIVPGYSLQALSLP